MKNTRAVVPTDSDGSGDHEGTHVHTHGHSHATSATPTPKLARANSMSSTQQLEATTSIDFTSGAISPGAIRSAAHGRK